MCWLLPTAPRAVWTHCILLFVYCMHPESSGVWLFIAFIRNVYKYIYIHRNTYMYIVFVVACACALILSVNIFNGHRNVDGRRENGGGRGQQDRNKRHKENMNTISLRPILIGAIFKCYIVLSLIVTLIVWYFCQRLMDSDKGKEKNKWSNIGDDQG